MQTSYNKQVSVKIELNGFMLHIVILKYIRTSVVNEVLAWINHIKHV